jgi:hypothetical protein
MTSPAEIIATPKGGGALLGIGEKFSPDLYTGTGNFTAPIALPLGRNGFSPQLSLVYSTGNGPFGLGRSLTVTGVSRKTSNGVPLYDDSKNLLMTDVFILSGSEDLVRVGTSMGFLDIGPEPKGCSLAFSKISRYLVTLSAVNRPRGYKRSRRRRNKNE